MGFDLIMIRKPTKVPRNVPKIIKESPGYFRGVPHEEMQAAGVFDNADYISVRYEKPADIKKDRWQEVFLLFDSPADGDPQTSLRKSSPSFRELRLMQTYLDKNYRHESALSKKLGKVPWIKFAGNDGKHVRPGECLVIALRLYKYLQKTKKIADRQFVKEFAAFNELAAKYGGYEVW
jgi:hypothetical protein